MFSCLFLDTDSSFLFGNIKLKDISLSVDNGQFPSEADILLWNGLGSIFRITTCGTKGKEIGLVRWRS